MAAEPHAAAAEYNRTIHVALLQRWRRTFLCHRCGATFVPGQAQEHQAGPARQHHG